MPHRWWFILVTVTVSVGGAVALVQKSPERTRLPPEPERLSRSPIEGSFGLGHGVTWSRPDMKVFRFGVHSPTRVVGVLHLTASELAANEVAIFLNGQALGPLPASGTDETLEVVLPPRLLLRERENELVVDHLRNPPASETWRVSRPWLELVPLPELSVQQTKRRAAQLARQGQLLEDAREAATDNPFRAWKAYREAWLSLEALDEKPELAVLVRERLEGLSRALDQRCADLLFQVRRAQHFGQSGRATRGIQELLRAFPTPEHRCHEEALRWNPSTGA